MGIKTQSLVLMFFCFATILSGFEFKDPIQVIETGWGNKPGQVSVILVSDMGIDGFTWPSKFIVDYEGYIYIYDLGRGRIQKFSKDGNFLIENYRDSIVRFPENKRAKLIKTYDIQKGKVINKIDSSIIRFKFDNELLNKSSINDDLFLNIYCEDYESKPVETIKKTEHSETKINIKRDNVVVMDRWGNYLGKIILPWTEFKVIEGEIPGEPYDWFGYEIKTYYDYIEVDAYGNVYVQGINGEKEKYEIIKFPKIYYKPVVVSQMLNKKTPNGIYIVSEYTIIPPGNIKKAGFKLLKRGEPLYRVEINIDLPLSTIKYLGKDNLGQYWVYFDTPKRVKKGKEYIISKSRKDWVIMKRERDRFLRKGQWRTVFSSELKSVNLFSIPGIITVDTFNLDRVKVSADGAICYKDDGVWFKQKYSHRMEFEKTDVKDFIKADENITAKSYVEYEDIDPVECERGIEIKKGNQSIRKFKYYSQDTLYTVQNLGLDDKNNIYVYVNWFDWLTKDKMKEVVKFNTKGEFQNRISLTTNETPVLGQDGYIYTYEKGEKGIIRKYEPKTLPE